MEADAQAHNYDVEWWRCFVGVYGQCDRRGGHGGYRRHGEHSQHSGYGAHLGNIEYNIKLKQGRKISLWVFEFHQYNKRGRKIKQKWTYKVGNIN